MDGFFYAKIDAYEVQVYSETGESTHNEGVIYLSLVDQAYPRAEMWFVDPAPGGGRLNELIQSGTGGAASFKAFFRFDKMALILDILNSRDNVWFTWDEARVAAIRAGREPVSEHAGDD